MKNLMVTAATISLALAGGARAHDGSYFELYPDDTGAVASISAAGRIDNTGAFFQSLGSNGRSCSTCHQADQAMGISTPQIRERFEQTRGLDPLFAAVDGANCPTARMGDKSAHSLLLDHGLIRIAITLPATAQFTVSVAHDPYGCALAKDPESGLVTVSQYRRPLPTTNLRYLSTMMFDGRESPATSPLNKPATFAANLQADLTHQAQSALTTHAQSAGPATTQQLADIVAFELALTTAQVYDREAGVLDARGAEGGVKYLSTVDYHPGINDVLGADPAGIAFNPASMSLFSAWVDIPPQGHEDRGQEFEFGRNEARAADRAAARRDIAAGEVLFNSAPLTITSVRGLNDNPAIGATLKGTCTTCHDAPNVGDHSLPLPLDIGTAHTPRSGLESDPNIVKAMAELNEPDLPVYLITGCPNPFGSAPVSFYTTDLGKGAVTGLCGDLNRVKGPILRGLAARAPYFHNGAASTLDQAVNFYNQRFSMNLSDDQKRQLVAFLNSL
jgi:cytochrome c peroxidase